MFDPRILALLSEVAAEQQARARLWLTLDMLTDMCDTRAFCDVLADVAKSRADHSRLTAADRERWQRLAEVADLCAKATPALKRTA